MRQDIPSLSYRLPLLLWHTTEILPHPVRLLLLLFLPLLLSLSFLSCFLCYNFTFLHSVSFPSPVASSRLSFMMSAPSSSIVLPFSSSSCLSHTPALVIFFSLLHPVRARLIFRAFFFFFSFLYLHTKRQNKRDQEGVGESENARHLLSRKGTVPLKVEGAQILVVTSKAAALSSSLAVVFL